MESSKSDLRSKKRCLNTTNDKENIHSIMY